MAVVSVVVLVLLVPSQGWAQALQSFEDLALRVNLYDQLQVEDQLGGKATGRLTRLARKEIAIQTDAGEKRFTRDDVRGVALRGHALRRGAIIGAGGFAVLGTIAVCSRDGIGACSIAGPMGAAPIGAGVGLAIGSLIPQMKGIYRAPASPAAAPLSRPRSGMRASLLEDVGLWVNLDDGLRVEEQSGTRSTGRLKRLTDNELTIETATGEKRFTRETLRQVAVRHHSLRGATLIGAGAGAAYGALAWCRGADRTECPDGTIIWSAFGAGAGLVVGLVMHRTNVVYPEAEREKAPLRNSQGWP